MSTDSPSPPISTAPTREVVWAQGLSLFAGVLMVVAGAFHVLAGIAALIRDVVFVSTGTYVYAFDLTGWGWAHVVLGAVLVVVGVAVLQGKSWGRISGIVLASLSLIANFLFLPYYPVWALLIIALDIAVIWGLATYKPTAQAGGSGSRGLDAAHRT